MDKSPEEEIKDQIRIDYKNTYANVIFTMTSKMMLLEEKIVELNTRPKVSTERLEEIIGKWMTPSKEDKYIRDLAVIIKEEIYGK